MQPRAIWSCPDNMPLQAPPIYSLQKGRKRSLDNVQYLLWQEVYMVGYVDIHYPMMPTQWQAG